MDVDVDEGKGKVSFAPCRQMAEDREKIRSEMDEL